MAPPKVMSGARAKIGYYDPNTGQTTFVGIFSDITLGLSYDTQPVYILGRYSAAEIDYTAQAPISFSMSGYRSFGHGAHVAGYVPTLDKLLTHEYLTVVVVDRQNPSKNLYKISSVRPLGYNTSLSSRQLEQMSLSFVGIILDDEDTANAETGGAAQAMDLP